MKIRHTIWLALLLAAVTATGQIPQGYYNPAQGLTGPALQQALHDIIDNHTVVSYTSLWTWFKQTDKKSNGKVWDMYSDIPGGIPPYEYTFVTDQCGSYTNEGDCYNREHSWPRSWFSNKTPMDSDIHHLYPTDGKVNGMRDNYPYGKVGTATWTSLNGSKRGNCVTPGYSGVVFEPRDEYKGDLARTYFYMETRYLNEDAGWAGSPMTNGSQLLPWAQTMMLLWHLQDPVSAKEIARNDSIYKNVQHNRNPFIDHPEYAGQIWPQYMPQPGTYTWNVTSGNWSNPGSWSPARTVAVAGDVLVFSGTTTPVCSATFDVAGGESAGRIRVINGASVTITATAGSGAITIGMAGAVSPQLEITAGTTLTLSGSAPVVLNLPAGFNGTMAGNVTFTGGAHQLTASGTGALVISGPSVFTAGPGFSGTPFGTASSNSVIFGTGTTYVSSSGLPPFGMTAPASVVVFQPGSIYRHTSAGAPSLSGRVYADVVIDAPGMNQSVTSGTLPCTINNLTVVNASLAGFDFPGGTIVKGDLAIQGGHLRFDPVAGLLTFAGTAVQTVSGPGTLTIGTGCDVEVGAASNLRFTRSVLMGKDFRVVAGGKVTVMPGFTLTVAGSATLQP